MAKRGPRYLHMGIIFPEFYHRTPAAGTKVTEYGSRVEHLDEAYIAGEKEIILLQRPDENKAEFEGRVQRVTREKNEPMRNLNVLSCSSSCSGYVKKPKPE